MREAKMGLFYQIEPGMITSQVPQYDSAVILMHLFLPQDELKASIRGYKWFSVIQSL